MKKNNTSAKSKTSAKHPTVKFSLTNKGLEVSVNVSEAGELLATVKGRINGLMQGLGAALAAAGPILQQFQSGQGAPAPSPQTPEQQWAAMSPKERKAAVATAPRGMAAVVESLRALQEHRYGSSQEYQQLIDYMLQEMPESLRSAIIKGDGSDIFDAADKAVVDKDARAWMSQPAIVTWLADFAQHIKPSVEARVAADKKASVAKDVKRRAKRAAKRAPKAASNSTAQNEAT